MRMRSHNSTRLLLATIFLVAILLTSLGLNFYLFNRGRGYYLELNATRLDPLGLGHFSTNPDQRRLTDPDRATVVFFGDSRAASWPAPSNLAQFEFTNRGIGTQTSAQGLLRFDFHVKPLRPQIVVIQIGINDLKTLPLFPERKATIIADCQENLRQIVARSVDLGATVFLSTIFLVGLAPLERRIFWSNDVALAVREVNAYIRSLESADVVILDTYALLADNKGITRAAYRADLLHLNARGYELLNEELVRMLENWEQTRFFPLYLPSSGGRIGLPPLWGGLSGGVLPR
jgi:lysophospholipase L1-like esterase